MAYIGKQPVVGNFQVCDAITVVNGQAAYTMQVSSANVEPENANHMLVSLNGVLQKPGSSFTISGATITFASNLATGDVIDFIILLGNVLDIGTPSDGTVTTAKLADDAVTAAKLASGAGGKVLQVVTATDSTERSTTSSSLVTASNTLSVDITPAATSSKVLVITTFNSGNSSGSDTRYTIKRDSTDIGDTSEGIVATTHADANLMYATAAMSVLDSPSSTSALTYQVYLKAAGGTGYINKGGTLGTITVMEIGA